MLPGLVQLAVALPRCNRATAALEALCSLQEAAELDGSTATGVLTAALQVRVSCCEVASSKVIARAEYVGAQHRVMCCLQACCVFCNTSYLIPHTAMA
jgi:hypothetical protein